MNNIKSIRKSQNISVTELAKALNMSQSNLTKIENNQLELKQEVAEKIAKILNVSITALNEFSSSKGTEIINPEVFNLPLLSTLNIIPNEIQNKATIKVYITTDDTMSPTINNQSIVIIDTNQKEIKNGIFLIKINNKLLISRLQTTNNSIILLHFDNIFYTSQELNISDITIIGKVLSCFNYTSI